MAKNRTPDIPKELYDYYADQLYRELAHMFKWEGLPQTVPVDYLERNLVRNGYVLFYEEESIGLDVLRAEVMGYNRHNLPTSARTFTPTTNSEVNPQITRNIKYLSDSKDIIEQFNPNTDGILIRNMEYSQSMHAIVEFYAKRLALAQQAFDTNLLWANVPYIFQVSSEDTRISIEKMFSEIFEGKPFTIVDKHLLADNQDRTGVPSGINFIGKELMDIINEIKMQFKQTVGFNTAGVDKAERVNTLEIQSNDQHTQSVLEIMLRQRKQACEAINAFFNQSISVEVVGQEKIEQAPEDKEGGGEIDSNNTRTGEITQD